MARRIKRDGKFLIETEGLGSVSLDDGYLTGQILIAMPAMRDPRFAQSVVYMCDHSADGAMGLIINKPLDNLSFDDLLKQLSVEPAPPARRIRMHSGGPVETGRGLVLHTADWVQDGSLKVDHNIALTHSVDVLKEIARGGGPRLGFLALGYARWGAGQLDEEIQQNAWLSAPADEALIFGTDPGTTWRRAFAALKIDPLLLSGTAGRA